MKIIDLFPYIIDKNSTMQFALEKLNSNNHKLLFVVDSVGKLFGSLSDGDLRRWILEGNILNEKTMVWEVFNPKPYFLIDNDKTDLLDLNFQNGKKIIPVVNSDRKIIYLRTALNNSFYISDYQISETSNVFIIAEIGNNHQGCFDTAKKLVHSARDAGVQCVKFQMRSMGELYGYASGTRNDAEDLGSQYTIDLINKFQLSDDELFRLFDYSAELGLVPLCTPWDLLSLAKLEDYGMPAYKVASADFTNHILLSEIIKTGKPMICSTGMSSEDEIHQTIQFLNGKNAEYILLHCNSTYPTPYKDVQLNYLKSLKKLTGGLVGYSGHERGIHVPIAACALGAKVIEKHITFDRELEGVDHKVSLLPNEFKSMVEMVRDVTIALGYSHYKRRLSQGEIINRQTLAKSIYVKDEVLEGREILRANLEIRSPGRGLQPNMIDKIVGIKANRYIHPGTELHMSDLTGKVLKKEKYQISRLHGIPVRYHDYEILINGIQLDFVEFHLSYSDLKLDHNKFLTRNLGMGCSVHCPELFEDDHLLDLTSPDKKYRETSISYVKRTIELSLELAKLFPRFKKPTLIVNAGGWCKDSFFDQEAKNDRYRTLQETLHALDLSEINFAIQTMPPFPWHFGGQSHHNLFVSPDEIKNFCDSTDSISICLDTSHSMLACNYYGWDFLQFVKQIGPYITYIHLADAKGIDGEGVQFGKGDINFYKTWKALNQFAPDALFIPEVWQGHVNNGAGFWSALEYVEGLEK